FERRNCRRDNGGGRLQIVADSAAPHAAPPLRQPAGQGEWRATAVEHKWIVIVNNNQNTMTEWIATREVVNRGGSGSLESMTKIGGRKPSAAQPEQLPARPRAAPSPGRAVPPRLQIVADSARAPVHCWAGAAAVGVLALGAGRFFLPLAGGTGSSCAYTGSGSDFGAPAGSRGAPPGRGAAATGVGS